MPDSEYMETPDASGGATIWMPSNNSWLYVIDCKLSKRI
jgi:hypothetical protein